MKFFTGPGSLVDHLRAPGSGTITINKSQISPKTAGIKRVKRHNTKMHTL